MFFFSRQPAPEIVEAPAFETVREDFVLDISDMKSAQIIDTLRQRTLDFTDRHFMNTGTTVFDANGVSIRIELTERQDVLYTINNLRTKHMHKAITLLDNAQLAF